MNEKQTENLTKAMRAVDALNSWVRSESHRRGFGGGRRAIYWLKRCATKAGVGSLPYNLRKVKSIVRCRDCGGSGRYVDWAGYEHGHCWACGSSGTARLYFIETEFSNGIKWHHPQDKCPIHVDGVFDCDTYQETDWKPNQTGRDLTSAEVAKYLNIAEMFFTERPSPYYTDYGGPYDDFAYGLDLGETPKGKCSFCQSPAKEGRYGVGRDHFYWHDRACKACADKWDAKGGAAIFDAFPFPEYLASDPEIILWAERHRLSEARAAA